MSNLQILIFILLIFSACVPNRDGKEISGADEKRWRASSLNGQLANEGFRRCQNFVHGWLAQSDSVSRLIPRNLDMDVNIWNAKDAAADNYPFMVLTSALTDSALFTGRMHDMLVTESMLTNRIGNLPDTYDFLKQDFVTDDPNLADIIFGSSEYIKDGLLPLTEWLGESPWSERMVDILDDIWLHAEVSTPFGKIPSENVEVNGEMLQVLSRIYYMTGDKKYLDWAIRLGDYYLLGDHHPTRDFTSLRLRDHGCEIVSGLCELYAVVHFSDRDKKEMYRPHIHEMLYRILEVGRNQDGLFYDVVDPQTGDIIRDRIADNFGYNLNGFYLVYQLDSIGEFQSPVVQALTTLGENYRDFDWENGSADGYADAIEGALNLYNRERVVTLPSWLDSEMQVMWKMQQPDGIIEGWHGDGNFARTTIMYCLWKSKGITASPWRQDLELGAEMTSDSLWITLTVDEPWSGKLIFDRARHQQNLHLPFDWPRINQFPEWFTAAPEREYKVYQKNGSNLETIHAAALDEGIVVELEAGIHCFLVL